MILLRRIPLPQPPKEKGELEDAIGEWENLILE